MPICAEKQAHLTHDTRGLDAVTGDVADREAKVAMRQDKYS